MLSNCFSVKIVSYSLTIKMVSPTNPIPGHASQFILAGWNRQTWGKCRLTAYSKVTILRGHLHGPFWQSDINYRQPLEKLGQPASRKSQSVISLEKAEGSYCLCNPPADSPPETLCVVGLMSAAKTETLFPTFMKDPLDDRFISIEPGGGN